MAVKRGPLKWLMKKKLTAFELCTCRRIFRISFTERKSNNFILSKTGTEPVSLETVMQRKLGYFRLISRTDDTLEGLVLEDKSRRTPLLRQTEENLK